MKRYDSYKDSGVEWIGKIPSGWKRTKLHILKCSGEIDYQDGNHGSVHPKSEDFIENGIPFLRPTDVFQNYISKEKLKYIPEEYVKKLRIGFTKQGDIIFVNRGNIGTTTILTGFENFTNVIINPQLTYIRTKEKLVNSNYLFYQTQSDVFQSNRDLKLGNGSVLNFLGLSDLGDYEMVIPPLSEQQQIVSFLDTKTSLIDSLIEKTQRKIELLKEKRTSLINEVVTKGLNPNVEMKDSGVEWIGEIPSGWEFVRIGHLNRVVRGGSPRPSGDPRFFNGDFIHWITVKDITSKTGKYVTTTDTKLTEEGMKQSRVLEPETLVLTNSGVTLGIPGILKIRGCINDGSVSFLDMSPKIERDYLYYFWTTQTELLLEQQSGYGQPNLNIEIVSNVRLPLPPLSEQQQIVEYLDEQTQLMDKTISIEEKRIELLKEYRQSLISEVVTGKLKVTTDE